MLSYFSFMTLLGFYLKNLLLNTDALGDRSLNPRVVLDELYRPSLKTEDPNLMKSKKGRKMLHLP